MDEDTAIAHAVADATGSPVADGIDIIYPADGLSSRQARQLLLLIDRERTVGLTEVTVYIDKDLDRVLDQDEKKAGAIFAFRFSDISNAQEAAKAAALEAGFVKA